MKQFLEVEINLLNSAIKWISNYQFLDWFVKSYDNQQR